MSRSARRAKRVDKAADPSGRFDQGDLPSADFLHDRSVLFEMVIANAPFALWAIDQDGVFTISEGLGEKVFEKHPGDVVGRSIEDVFSPMPHLVRGVRRVLKGEEYRAMLDIGGSVFESCFQPVFEENRENVLGAVGFAIDVTRQCQAEEAARQRQMELEHVSRVGVMGEVVSALAHELNQPLAAIANYAGGCVRRLRSGEIDEGDLAHVMQEVTGQAQRASEMIGRLRNFLQKREGYSAPVALNALVEEAAALAVLEAKQCHTRIRIEPAAGLPPVVVDCVPLQHALLNLMRNGIEAMEQIDPDGRELTVSTEAAADGTLHVSVRDRGCGLPLNYQHMIFEPFYTSKENGLGMGLSISRSIIEAHGGRLWAVPNPDGGATFSFSLPVCRGGASGQ